MLGGQLPSVDAGAAASSPGVGLRHSCRGIRDLTWIGHPTGVLFVLKPLFALGAMDLAEGLFAASAVHW
jgi:hypothetical protein